MTFNKFAAGRKVYGQGAASPTRGQVDPRGYIKRELARRSTQQGVSKVGADGKSDTRSGIAHNAIRNSLGNNTARPSAGSLNAPRQPQGGMTAMPQYGAGTQTGAGASPTGGAPVGSPGAAPTPAVQVSADGVLQLPYNSDFYNQAVDAQQNFDNEIMNLNMEDQQQNLEYEQFTRELESGYVDRQRETLGNSAGRGMLYSSQYTTGANRDATDYNNAKNDGVAQDTLFNSQVETRRNAAQQWLNTMLQRATQGYADSLAEGAGSLGYGSDGVTGGVGTAGLNAIPRSLGNNIGRPNAANLPKPPSMPGGVNSGIAGSGGGRPPKPGPNYEWNKNKGKWVKK